MDRPRVEAESDDLEVVGLALLYPALQRNVGVPGHHGYPRANRWMCWTKEKLIQAIPSGTFHIT